MSNNKNYNRNRHGETDHNNQADEEIPNQFTSSTGEEEGE